MIPVCEPVLDGQEERYLLECLRSGWISSAGSFVDEFERRFAALCDVDHAVSCSSGTAAIHLALCALEVGPGDEVICPDFNLIAGTNMVLLTGASARLVDVELDTWCIDPRLIEQAITPRTKAIMVVHMYGHPCDMDAINEIARRHELHVIEDAAQAHGAEFHGGPVGGFGDVGCFSFYGNKILTTGEGGMLVTRHAWLAERAKLLRNQAFGRERFKHDRIGFNYRLSNLQAAIGVAQVERLAEKVRCKRRIAASYTERLSSLPGVTIPVERPECKNVFWMYGVLLDSSIKATRQTIRDLLAERGIETRDFFHPIHSQPVYRKEAHGRIRDVAGHYPVSEHLGSRGFYLPSGLGLDPDQVEFVADAVAESVMRFSPGTACASAI